MLKWTEGASLLNIALESGVTILIIAITYVVLQ